MNVQGLEFWSSQTHLHEEKAIWPPKSPHDSQNLYQSPQGNKPFARLPAEVSEVLQAVECLITDRDANAAVILDYLETIAPMGNVSFMSDSEKANLVRLQRWTSNPMLLSTDNLVIMITENLSDVHRRLVSCAQLATVNIPLPD